MRRAGPRLLAGFLALAAAGAALAQGPPGRIEIRRGDEVVLATPEPEGAVRVLFVGNSLTYFNELPWIFQQVVESKRPEPPVVVRFSGGSGRSWAQHLREGEVARLLRTSRWDFVVLQEQSSRLILQPEVSRAAFATLLAMVRKNGAAAVVFETWPDWQEQEKRPIYRAAYERLTADHGVPLAPIGTAWEAALAAGIDPYRDVVHPNLAGTYLAACVLAAAVFDLDPRGAVFELPVSFEHVQRSRQSLAEERLSPATASRLQELAWQAVAARERSPVTAR